MHAVFSLLALLASSVAAQSTDLRLYVGGNADQKYVGSVVAVSGADTTLAIVCTAGTVGSGDLAQPCNGLTTVTATYFGTSEWRESTSIATSHGIVIGSASCSFKGTTQGVCTASLSLSVDGVSTSTEAVKTITGTALRYANVPITGGVQKLASATSSSKGAAAPTMGTELYKVIIVPGAAALLAGAALL